MRVIVAVAIAAALVGAAVLAAPGADRPAEKPDYREVVERLGEWVKRQEDADVLEKKDLEEARALVGALESLGAKELYDGLAPGERKKLRELLEREERLEGYAVRVDRIAADVGLPVEDTEALLDLYTTYREARREAGWNDREKREAAWDDFEKSLQKRFGRSKARAIANAIRRSSRRGR